MTKEKRIVFDASDILKARVICPKCEAETAYPLHKERVPSFPQAMPALSVPVH